MLESEKYNISTTKPPDRQTKEVIGSYNIKFRKLDQLFAVKFMLDGTGDIVGLFQAAQGKFYSYRGPVILRIL